MHCDLYLPFRRLAHKYTTAKAIYFLNGPSTKTVISQQRKKENIPSGGISRREQTINSCPMISTPEPPNVAIVCLLDKFRVQILVREMATLKCEAFEVLTAVTMKNIDFWDVTQISSVEVY
jgi:hypothetical protein